MTTCRLPAADAHALLRCLCAYCIAGFRRQLRHTDGGQKRPPGVPAGQLDENVVGGGRCDSAGGVLTSYRRHAAPLQPCLHTPPSHDASYYVHVAVDGLCRASCWRCAPSWACGTAMSYHPASVCTSALTASRVRLVLPLRSSVAAVFRLGCKACCSGCYGHLVWWGALVGALLHRYATLPFTLTPAHRQWGAPLMRALGCSVTRAVGRSGLSLLGIFPVFCIVFTTVMGAPCAACVAVAQAVTWCVCWLVCEWAVVWAGISVATRPPCVASACSAHARTKSILFTSVVLCATVRQSRRLWRMAFTSCRQWRRGRQAAPPSSS